ncbi:sodium:solute symporter family protein [Kordiimonas lacus]|uniref:Na+/proline symporter n=1 Tax=Kordiimonas lacus TaxID=637679 RepID=A0A1G6VNV3_9PROT|nr:sodium:solute symporter family protein [Kordiimonas lacus]SDD54506.1 Na+/proline symporter [Kordiimonas lacus]
MQGTEAILGPGGLIATFLYLASLLVIGWRANRASRETSLKDYYLAGSSMGAVSVFFTLYATQYSGNTLSAVPGNAYRNGFIGLSIVVAVMAIVLVYYTYAPALNRLSKKQSFVSIGDFIKWRFGSKPLLIAVNVIAILTLITYALGNFKAVGLLLETASGGAISFPVGILVLALVMAFYESLGGLRGVVWTDVIQGSLLFLGCLMLFFAVVSLNGPESVTNPTVLAGKLTTYFTDDIQTASFLSIVVLVAIGGAVYPQAIQRIYIAKDARTLKRSYAPLLVMPILTTLPMILVGMSVAEWRPDLSREQSENVIIYAVEHITGAYPSLAWLLILYLGAAIAAIMSTIDSAMLTLGSIVTKDMISSDLEEDGGKRLYRVSRYLSWALMMVMAVLAIVLPQTIWALLIFKFEFLIQTAPAFILGVRTARVTTGGVLWGLLAGVTVTLVLKLSYLVGTDYSHLGGIHAGLWGLMLNLLVIAVCASRQKASAA